MKKIIYFVIISLQLQSLLFAQVKKADKAGSWYPSNAEELSNELGSFLQAADPPKVKGQIIALISPHAGLKYSGPVAAFGYKLLQNTGKKTVIVIGFNHHMEHDGIAVFDYDKFISPLGEIYTDKKIVEKLIGSSSNIYSLKSAFKNEQSTEMQIPFLQKVLKDFKIVILSIGDQYIDNAVELSNVLYEVLKDKHDYVIVGSSDLSHYLPYSKCDQVDTYTLRHLMKFEPKEFFKTSFRNGHRLACGYGAITATMMAAKKLGADRLEILEHANSGDVTFDKQKVVGYVSAVMYKQQEGNMLDNAQQKELLSLARKTIEHYLDSGKKLEVEQKDPILRQDMGAFVTIHRQGQLRGCIGSIYARGPLYLTIRDMAIEAGFDDPRFMPLTKGELDQIDIEISVLSPLEKIEDPDIIEAGKHGVIVDDGLRKGVYLPQVATEQGWDTEQFMNSLCGQKAGMRFDAWKKGDCDIYIFTAEVFGELDS